MNITSPQALANTARWAAAQRARESDRADRVFFDPLARKLAGDEGMKMLQLSEEANPQRDNTAAYLAVRTRFFDNLTLKTAAQGIRQIVIIAAGMDSRAFRLDLPKGTELYELDQKAVLIQKQQALTLEGVEPRCCRIAVGVDLAADWAPTLEAAGFRPAERTLWIVEGLLYYLDDQQVERLLSQLSQLSTASSTLGADLVSASFLRSPWTKAALETMVAHGTPWRFGADDPESLFGQHGWRARVSQPGDDDANYGRWSAPVPRREQHNLPHSFLVDATRD
jgi:methyltransferase (TIGR00027 family)